MEDTFFKQAVEEYFASNPTFDPIQIIQAAFENEKIFFENGKVGQQNLKLWFAAVTEKLVSLGVELDLNQKLSELITNGKIVVDQTSATYEWRG